MPEPILLDLSHTSHTRARTGIQRVCRSLHQALGAEALAVTHDPHAEVWRLLEPWERDNLTSTAAEKKRGAQWPLDAKLLGRARRWLGGASSDLSRRSGAARAVLVPEVFSPGVAAALPGLFAATSGPRVALFHDAIALKFPELTPPKTVARFPAYLRELLAFDGIAAVSEDSRDTLLDYWRWAGVSDFPRVEAIPLGVDAPAGVTPHDAAGIQAPVLLTVGSIEGRKNHLALLEACERLWSRGAKFSLRLIGLAHPQTGAAALARIEALQRAGRALRYDGPIGDAALDAAYADCAFTVYPSLIEGFGLPVIESLSHGKPCVCSGRGALGESARGGGCVLLDAPDATHLAAAIGKLLESPAELRRLADAARTRKFKSWADYAAEITAWMRDVPRRRG